MGAELGELRGRVKDRMTEIQKQQKTIDQQSTNLDILRTQVKDLKNTDLVTENQNQRKTINKQGTELGTLRAQVKDLQQSAQSMQVPSLLPALPITQSGFRKNPNPQPLGTKNAPTPAIQTPNLQQTAEVRKLRERSWRSARRAFRGFFLRCCRMWAMI